MRFEVKNLEELKEAVNLIDNDDRLSLNLSINSKFPQLTDMKFIIRLTEKGIFIHEMIGILTDNE